MRLKQTKIASFLASAMLISGVACNNCQKTQCDAGINSANFDSTINGIKTELVTLKNANGMQVQITNFGGRIVSILLNDKNGDQKDVVLGFDNIKNYADYQNTPSDFGASIGRYANRICHGKIVCSGDTVQLPINNFGHCLHGGPTGWQYQVYQIKEKSDSTLTLELNSKDGDNNFPGNVTAQVKFLLDSQNKINIDYTATTDKQTVINMTNHSYFNLNGDADKNIENCILMINADNYTPVDSSYMPTGIVAPVAGTPFDFKTPAAVSKDCNNMSNTQIKYGNGFDHNWCLNTYDTTAKAGDVNKKAATLYSPLTGIKLTVYTNEPGIQCYSGNFLDGKVTGKYGKVYNKHAGICLETQKYPNSPNVASWASPYLNPGETYHSVCVFVFSIE